MYFSFSHLKSEPSDLTIILATDNSDSSFSHFDPLLQSLGYKWSMRATGVLGIRFCYWSRSPSTYASCFYARVSDNVRQEEIWRVSYFYKHKALPISLQGTRTFGSMKQKGTTGRYHQHSSLNFFYLYTLYLQHFSSLRRSSRCHMYSVAQTARWHSTVLIWKSDFC